MGDGSLQGSGGAHRGSEYYQYLPSGRSIPARIAVSRRRRIFRRYVQTIGVDPSYRVVDVGVTNNEGYALDNYFEALYPWKEKILPQASLSKRELRAAAQAAGLENIRIASVSLLGWATNLLLIATRRMP